jgi:hypothetical protein
VPDGPKTRSADREQTRTHHREWVGNRGATFGLI